MKKCNDKKVIKKSPESAIATFLAMEDFNNAVCAIMFLYRLLKISHKNKRITHESQPFYSYL